MGQKAALFRGMVATIILLVGFTLSACSRSSNPSPAPGGGAVINSDSIITGQIKAIRPEATGYPWEVDVLIQTSQNVGDLPNPTGDKIGQIITAKTDVNMNSFSVGQIVTARVKYVGDVPKPGISLYIYNITAK